MARVVITGHRNLIRISPNAQQNYTITNLDKSTVLAKKIDKNFEYGIKAVSEITCIKLGSHIPPYLAVLHILLKKNVPKKN